MFPSLCLCIILQISLSSANAMIALGVHLFILALQLLFCTNKCLGEIVTFLVIVRIWLLEKTVVINWYATCDNNVTLCDRT